MPKLELITLVVATEDHGGGYDAGGLDYVIDTLRDNLPTECMLLDYDSEELLLTLKSDSINFIRERLHILQEAKKPKAAKPAQAGKEVTK